MAEASATPGYALDLRYQTKIKDSYQDCQRMGITFLPIVAEFLGGWHKITIGEIKKLSATLARHTGEEEGEMARRTFVRLSIILMKGNAAILTNRIPCSPDQTL